MQLILLIEDDQEIREATLEFLDMENFKAIGFPSGVEALEYLKTESNPRPALIITDMNMPRMDGPSFRAAQLSIPRLRDIPCVVLSADLRIEAKFQNLQLSGIVSKPIDLDQLSEVVKQSVAGNTPATAHDRARVITAPDRPVLSVQQINVHDVLNEISAAKMHAEILATSPELPVAVLQRLKRIDEKLENAIGLLRNASIPDNITLRPVSVADAKPLAGTVILVDDSADLRSLFTSYLNRRGISAFAANDADEAISVIQQFGAPAVLLIDKHLGSTTGVDVLNGIEKVFPRISVDAKVILFTSDSSGIADPRFIAQEGKARDLKSLEAIVRKYLT